MNVQLLRLIVSVASLVFLPCLAMQGAEQKDRIGTLKGGTPHISLVKLICTPEKYNDHLLTTTGFVGVEGLPNLKTRLFLSSEDARMTRDENSTVIAQDRIEFSYDFLRRLKGKFVFIQGMVHVTREASAKEEVTFEIKANYIQILGPNE